ncbi:MAG: tetratricopeptide repeat protein, partial [candidate division Zixibacteria bacterium]|nr:tetratricopeptide repeat protein [candidate division Zixibacteria bacterium]
MAGIILGLIGIVLGLVGIFVTIIVPLIGYFYHKSKKFKALYHVIWKKSSSLKPDEVLGERPYKEYYYLRPEDELIGKCLKNKSNVLIIGSPLSGKTRAAYQALISLNKRCNVLIPRCDNINLETFIFPKNFRFWRHRIILIDDLHRFVEQQNFEHLFKVAKDNSAIIVSTCRGEIEYQKVKNKMAEKGMDLEKIFCEVIELKRISEDEGKKIAGRVEIKWDEVKFDGTVGSIFMRLLEMEKRFDECDNFEKTILRGLRDLYLCGIFEERQVFPLEWIKIVAKKEELEGKDFEWTGWLEKLKSKEFIILEKDKVRAEEVYLEYIVKPKEKQPALELFRETYSAFSGVPAALFALGNRACDLGDIRLEKAEYLKIAIKAYEEALKVYTLERFPMQYAVTQNNLGNAYGTLSEIDAKADNCTKAIKAFEEALKVYTLERFPMDYAMTQNNLGNAYRILAEVEAKAESCKKAIKACEEALNVYTFERFSMDYAMTQNNLGNAYRTLAEVEAKA